LLIFIKGEGMKVGIGYDVHALTENRKLIIGGVIIPYEKGLQGHSDADVLIHAIMDSLLGAMGKGDIGKLFPDTDNRYKDADSRVLLRKVYELMRENKFTVGNIDAVIIAQKPKISPFIDEMKDNIANDLETDISNINIKATTTERLGFEGRGEGIAAQCISLLETKEN
jgi:2-C-methyl-D-erythritol 2,4-cyclodiphosphate synthase